MNPAPPSHLRIALLLLAAISVSGCANRTGSSPDALRSAIHGRVILDGTIPRSWLAGESDDSWIGELHEPPPGWDGTPPREIEVGPGKGVRGVAVWLEPVDAAVISPEVGPVRAGQRSIPPVRTVRLEGSCFWPSMIVIPAGDMIRLVNADVRPHHVQSIAGETKVNATVGTGRSVDVRFGHPGNLRLSCNDHAFMRVDLVVVPGHWFAITDARGAFTIPDVPEGTYRLRLAHHRLRDLEEPVLIDTRQPPGEVHDVIVQRGNWAIEASEFEYPEPDRIEPGQS